MPHHLQQWQGVSDAEENLGCQHANHHLQGTRLHHHLLSYRTHLLLLPLPHGDHPLFNASYSNHQLLHLQLDWHTTLCHIINLQTLKILNSVSNPESFHFFIHQYSEHPNFQLLTHFLNFQLKRQFQIDLILFHQHSLQGH